MKALSGLSLEEFLRLPETEPPSEYVDGEIVQKVAPQADHGVLQYTFARWIDDATWPDRLGQVVPEVRCVLPGRSYIPDVSYVRAERLPRDENGRIAGNLVGAPDLAVEILSPGQDYRWLVEKLEVYVDNGAVVALLVNPADESVGVRRPGTSFQRLHGDDVLSLPEVAPDLRARVRG